MPQDVMPIIFYFIYVVCHSPNEEIFILDITDLYEQPQLHYMNVPSPQFPNISLGAPIFFFFGMSHACISCAATISCSTKDRWTLKDPGLNSYRCESARSQYNCSREDICTYLERANRSVISIYGPTMASGLCSIPFDLNTWPNTRLAVYGKVIGITSEILVLCHTDLCRRNIPSYPAEPYLQILAIQAFPLSYEKFPPDATPSSLPAAA